MKENKDLELENQAKRDKALEQCTAHKKYLSEIESLLSYMKTPMKVNVKLVHIQNSVRQLVVSTITLLIVGIY
ncbi:MAG: hypothetical protein PUB46_06135 [Lachnospiraceae bacterium]|nr:hypothetical protein [Lachnospiraceae bacterium]